MSAARVQITSVLRWVGSWLLKNFWRSLNEDACQNPWVDCSAMNSLKSGFLNWSCLGGSEYFSFFSFFLYCCLTDLSSTFAYRQHISSSAIRILKAFSFCSNTNYSNCILKACFSSFSICIIKACFSSFTIHILEFCLSSFSIFYCFICIIKAFSFCSIIRILKVFSSCSICILLAFSLSSSIYMESQKFEDFFWYSPSGI